MIEVYRDVPKVDFYDRSPMLKDAPLLSVIIPARNEEENIGICLRAVLSQEYRNLEVIVINDNSTDRTAEIIQTFATDDRRLQMINGEPLPPGWSGRVYACAQGADRAQGSYYLILDADTELSPGGLARALSYALEHDTDLVAAIPKTDLGNLWESLIQPLMGHLFLIQFKAKALNDPGDATAMAWGGFLLFRRQAYEQIGGHLAMKGAVVDGPQLAVKIKQNRLRLAYVLGTNVVTARMYSPFRTVWNGWTRCIFLGLNRSVGRGLAAMAALLVFMVLPWIIALAGLSNLLLRGGSPASLGFFLLWSSVCLVSLSHRFVMRSLFDFTTRYAWLQPVSALLVIGILANSIWRVLARREISWRGRVYPTTG
ncbi:MAG: glycosyltransferase [Acidobacteria bacterium]|nr:glycosyltransferase [Acidobacteriota bacterium]